MPDLIIKNATIIDGTGDAAYAADLAVTKDKIEDIGKGLDPESAAEVLDAEGLTLTPGFIDIHTHSDFSLLDNPLAHSRVLQGVTTEVTGNCGGSPGPVPDAKRPAFMEYMTDLGKAYKMRFGIDEWPWQSLDEFMGYLFDPGITRGVSLNVAPLVGHGTLRAGVMGYAPGVPDDDALEAMGRLLAQEMEKGAFGLSSGLIYHPGAFAQKAELAALAKITSDCGGIYSTHMRSEGKYLFEAVDEAVAVAEDSGVSLEISHLKCETPAMWGKAKELLTILDRALDRGVKLNFDQYPYTAWASGFIEFFPTWTKENGAQSLTALLKNRTDRKRVMDGITHPPADWDNPMEGLTFDKILINGFRTEENLSLNGLSLAGIAHERNQDPLEAAFDIFCEEKGLLGMIVFAMDEADLETILRHPAGMVGSDGRSVTPSDTGENLPVHPRFYGTFPRVLSRYVRDRQTISLEQAVYKMTGLPARKLNLKDRGLIRTGMAADLVLFNPAQIKDQASFDNPHQTPGGIDHVFINGQAVVRKGTHTGKRPGRRLSRT